MDGFPRCRPRWTHRLLTESLKARRETAGSFFLGLHPTVSLASEPHGHRRNSRPKRALEGYKTAAHSRGIAPLTLYAGAGAPEAHTLQHISLG